MTTLGSRFIFIYIYRLIVGLFASDAHSNYRCDSEAQLNKTNSEDKNKINRKTTVA